MLRVDEDTANAVREFLNDNEVHGVYLETDAKRYYPYGSLAAHVIGFVGTDNNGLYGLEAQYEEELQGQTGLVVSAKDNGGNALPYEYEQYYASHNGDDLVLTLDTNVQYYLEKYVKEMADQFEAANGATGIVMDVKTGGVLGMVSYPNYDLNNYSEVSDARLKAAIEDGSASLADQQLRQWRNKALNDTYEPGSTFKILTLSAALEEGVVDMSSTFECSGSITVMGQTIHCSNTSGHGHQTLKEATGNSCNPAFINCGLGLGTDTFYEYMRSFGLLDGSGIDLAGEATRHLHGPERFLPAGSGLLRLRPELQRDTHFPHRRTGRLHNRRLPVPAPCGGTDPGQQRRCGVSARQHPPASGSQPADLRHGP